MQHTPAHVKTGQFCHVTRAIEFRIFRTALAFTNSVSKLRVFDFTERHIQWRNNEIGNFSGYINRGREQTDWPASFHIAEWSERCHGTTTFIHISCSERIINSAAIFKIEITYFIGFREVELKCPADLWSSFTCSKLQLGPLPESIIYAFYNIRVIKNSV